MLSGHRMTDERKCGGRMEWDGVALKRACWNPEQKYSALQHFTQGPSYGILISSQ